MPKEVVHDLTGSFSLKIGWEKDRHVQVATIKPDAELRMSYVGSEDGGEGEGEVFYGDGLYATLDREGINRAIRALRRARDQVFGKDE